MATTNKVIDFPTAVRSTTVGRHLIPARIRDARKAKRMTQTELGDALGVTRQSVSAYETGEKVPEADKFSALVTALDQPLSFFMTHDLALFGEQKPNFFRKCGPERIRQNEACAVWANWFVQTARYFDDYINYPDVDLPKAEPRTSSGRYLDDEIEDLADACRQHWGLGLGPISNVLSLLESKGVAVCRGDIGTEHIDAFSFWNGNRPFVFMAAENKSSARNRYDLSHELGHLILHRWIEEEELKDPKILKMIEAEADRFAGAFLLPRRSFSKEIYTSRLEAFLALKKRWKVSIQAMVYRCAELDIIDDRQYTNLFKQISFKKWRKTEPLDDPEILPLEQPKLLRRAVELMLEGNRKHPDEILTDLNFNANLVAAFCNLPKDVFMKHPNDSSVVTLK